MLRPSAVPIAASVVLAIAMMLCAPAQTAAQSADRSISVQWSPIGIDYAPETRCSDNNPTWLTGQRPVACNPQLSEHCGDSLNTCPARCQKCYDDDLSFVQRRLKVNAITIYAPNYYVLKAARRLGMKVVLGLYNDSVLGLGTPDSQTNCSYGGTPLYLCGSKYASALIDGGCIDAAGGNPFARCASRCAVRSNPASDCQRRDCSCDSDPECKGAANKCMTGADVVPLNNSATGEFLRNGTIIALQLGNEFFEQCQIPEAPGNHQPCCAYSKRAQACRGWTVNRQVFSVAAQTLRRALNSRGLNKIKISVALVAGQGTKFCEGGAPPPGIDYIAAHPYCEGMAEVPPYWTTHSGAECWHQARDEQFAIDRKACGAAHTYIGETGYNSGCPSMPDGASRLKAERDFVRAMLGDQPACSGKPNAASMPNFLFEFADSGPASGCISGCGDPARCNPWCCCKHQCSDKVVCASGCPSCFGNGYFGLYHTPGYGTVGFPPEPKFDPMPSLLCPARK